MSHKAGFFIIGAAKSGTTTLAHVLSKHPEVYFSPVKEPNFFSTDIDPSAFEPDYRKRTLFLSKDYFDKKPLKELHLSFIRDKQLYEKLFEDAQSHQIAGEGSTSYLYSDAAAGNIRAYNPQAKIIAILRNPVQRAFSHYLMGIRYGYTRLSFREAVEEDMNRSIKGWGISRLYLELGMYYRQLERYYHQFDPSQMRVFLFDDLLNAPEGLFAELFSFLGVSPFDAVQPEKQNEAMIPRYPVLNRILSDAYLSGFAKRLLSAQGLQKLKDKLYSKGDLPVLADDDKAFLNDIYKDDIKNTAQLTGLNLDHWLEG